MAHGVPTLENRNWLFKKKAQIIGHFIREPSRYVLDEYFAQKPALNTDVGVAYNLDFETLGTSMTTADVTFPGTIAGIQLDTHGADNDQAYICPHLNTDQTAWASVLWGTENQVVWETAIKTNSAIATTLIWAGLKLTADPTVATDNDQVFFRYSTDDSDTNWEIVSSIGGTDTTTDSGIAVAASTTYQLRIEIDSDRKAHFYIDNVLLYSTAALTNDIDFIPYIGIQALDTGKFSLFVAYEKISRFIYE